MSEPTPDDVQLAVQICNDHILPILRDQGVLNFDVRVSLQGKEISIGVMLEPGQDAPPGIPVLNPADFH